MKVEIVVPAMGESITEAVVGSFLKESGQTCAMDEEIIELETDKVNQVLYAPNAGKVEWTVNIDDTVQIGQVIGIVDTEAAGDLPKKEPTPALAESIAPSQLTKSSSNIRVSVAEFVQDVQQGQAQAAVAPQATSTPPAPSPVVDQVLPDLATGTRSLSKKPLSRIRKVIAKRLVEAQSTAAMLTTFNEVDMSHVMKIRSAHKDEFLKKHGAKLGFMSFFVKAVVSALKCLPDINSRIEGEEIVHPNFYDIGIAVGTEKGLIVPVLRNCELMSFSDIEKGIVDYAVRARKGKLSIDELQGGSFTITNGGIFGSMLSTPILNPPQSGILGMHNIVQRPIAVEGKVEIRPIMYLALSYDHRIVDGKEAVTFLVHLKEMLEDPSRLMLEM